MKDVVNIRAFIRSTVMTIIVLIGLVYYQTDGTFDFSTGNVLIENTTELDTLIHTQLDMSPLERPDEIVFDYATNEEMPISSEEILELISIGGYNAKSVHQFSMRSASSYIHPDQVTISLGLNYLDDSDDELYIESEIQRVLSEIITDDMSEYEKVEAVNHYIVNHTTYDYSDPKKGQSVRVLLEDGTGVCAAYARTTSRMLDVLGIENIGVSGEAYGDDEWIAHAWNKVKVDGEWYVLDTTWNHPRTVGGKHSEYFYFLVSDAFIADTHQPMKEDFYPAVNSQYENQYKNDFSDVLPENISN